MSESTGFGFRASRSDDDAEQVLKVMWEDLADGALEAAVGSVAGGSPSDDACLLVEGEVHKFDLTDPLSEVTLVRLILLSAPLRIAAIICAGSCTV